MAQAQTATWPYTTANKLAWESPAQNGTAAQAQALVGRLYVDGSASFTPITWTTCTGTPVVCTAALTTALLAIFNAWARGTHTLELSLFDGTTESAKSSPFSQMVGPAPPVNLTIRP